MDIRNIRAIHARAHEALSSASGDPRKIVLYYTLICSAMALTASVITGVLSDQIAGTGGLSNIGLRSILSTGRSILPIIQMIITACLGLGYAMAVLRISRGEYADARTLAEGFRHFGPILRATIFQSLIYISYGFLSIYLAAFIFVATPFAKPFLEALVPAMDSGAMANGQLVLDEAAMMAATEAMGPMLWIALAIFLLLFIPAYYGYRMTTFCLAENPRRGALAAMSRSKVLMRRNKIALLKLDLSMWWFYGLQAVVSIVCYGDVILAMLGVQLPWSDTVSYYGFFVLSLILQTVGFYYLMNRVETAYAVGFDALQEGFERRMNEKYNFPFPTEY